MRQKQVTQIGKTRSFNDFYRFKHDRARVQLIGGTWYGGEMKKGLFSVMNYLLPQRGTASMHCSANE